jgi:hypothetical protein
MAWTVVDPTSAMRSDTKVARVDVPYFPDEIEYEQIMGRAYSDPSSRDWMASGGSLILATPGAYSKLERLMNNSQVNVPERTMREETTKLALERQIVVLRWLEQ